MSNPFCPCHEQTTKKITSKSNFIEILHYSCKHLSWRKHVNCMLNCAHVQHPVAYMKKFKQRLTARLTRPIVGSRRAWLTEQLGHIETVTFCSQTCECKFFVFLLMNVILEFLT